MNGRHQGPRLGQLVVDCRREVHRITQVHRNDDLVILDDDFSCSFWNCCEPVRSHDLPRHHRAYARALIRAKQRYQLRQQRDRPSQLHTAYRAKKR